MDNHIKKAVLCYIPFLVVFSAVVFLFFDINNEAVLGIYISNLISATLLLASVIVLSIMGSETNEFASKSPFANMAKRFEICEIILSAAYGVGTYLMTINNLGSINILLYIIAQLVAAVILFSQFNAYPLEKRFVNPVVYKGE